MTTVSIIAFLAFLSAFNVPTTTVQQVSSILYASQNNPKANVVEVATTTPTTITLTPTVDNSTSTPSFGATIQTQPVVQNPMPQSKADITIAVENPSTNSPYYTFTVSVLDDNGKPIKQAPVHMDAPDAKPIQGQEGIVDRTTNQDDGNEDTGFGKWTTHFTYGLNQTLTKGTQAVTFTSGSLSKSITINVE